MTASRPARIVCLGEVLLRLNPPPGELLMQGRALNTHTGGAEANVAVALSGYGATSAMATVLPDNALGRGARDELRRHGVETSHIGFAPGRMGLYFLTPGAVRRPSEVIYDRAASAFAEQAPGAFDWPAVFDGADWLHVSGVTPAVGPQGSRVAVEAVEAAVAAGVRVSFDGNFRARLWREWAGDPPATLGRMLSGAAIAFADERDFSLVLQRNFEAETVEARRRLAAAAAFEAFPRLSRICCTLRVQDGVADQALSAVMFVRDGADVIEHRADPITLSGVVDRVGGGDAFAAGVLFGVTRGWPDAEALAFGLAAAGLKHSIYGDFNLFTVDEVRDAMVAEAFDIKR